MDKRKQLRVECIHSRYKIFNYIYFCFVNCVSKCFNFKFLKLERKLNPFILQRTSLVAQTVKRLPTMQDTRVRSLGQEDPLEKAMATHSSTLAWKIPWTEEHGTLQSMGSQKVGHDWATSLSFYRRRSCVSDSLNSIKELRTIIYQVEIWIKLV